MKHSDVEELARNVGLIEPRDVWADLPSDYRQALCSFAALVLENAAQTADDSVSGFKPRTGWELGFCNGVKTHVSCLRAMSAAMQSGDRV